ncbi:SAM-dependent methyltransferase [Bacillus sp. 196mf]|uniref:SAM-dependent methyltransferase n=1 Tax=Bacillus sp. 196mf TaxID=1761754 RepID=UPI000D8B53BD|nr:SAM-dependent methyltransferase [Bacillus sp. 196mf]PYE88866.1 N-6 DNA methylase [Bacillus sp. 196mf]
MSNIGNKLRSGFFATPEQQGKYLVELFNKPKGSINIFDPTCGEGRILKQIAKHLDSDENQMKTYGVEVYKARNKVAMELLDYCSNAAIETMVVQRNHPPYDFEMLGADDLEGAKRKEFIELERATRYLAGEGIMCYVIPSYRFVVEKVARKGEFIN